VQKNRAKTRLIATTNPLGPFAGAASEWKCPTAWASPVKGVAALLAGADPSTPKISAMSVASVATTPGTAPATAAEEAAAEVVAAAAAAADAVAGNLCKPTFFLHFATGLLKPTPSNLTVY
jgi:hypothetical protein